MAENLEEINLPESLREAREWNVPDLATIESVDVDGVTLVFDGDSQSAGKKYKVNISEIFFPGDRVKISKISGSYVVEYVIGSPGTRLQVPAGGNAGHVLKKRSSADFDFEWGQGSLPPQSSSTSGKVLKSNGTEANWEDEAALPRQYITDKGKFLKTDGSSASWETINEYDGPTIKGSGTSSIGFFGGTATSKKSISKLSTYGTADAATNRTKINEILTALDAYGLITSR